MTTLVVVVRNAQGSVVVVCFGTDSRLLCGQMLRAWQVDGGQAALVEERSCLRTADLQVGDVVPCWVGRMNTLFEVVQLSKRELRVGLGAIPYLMT